MTEERTTITETPDGSTHTRTTVYTDGERRGGGGGKWIFLVVLLIAVVGGLLVFNQLGGAEMAKDTAIADAASDVGNAAEKVGDAAQDVADDVTNN